MKRIFSIWIALAVPAALAGCAVSPDVPRAAGEDTAVVGTGLATVCCHEFPEVLSRRVHPVLDRIEDITRLQRLVRTDGSLCYRFHYDGPLDPLEVRLERELRVSSSLPFRIERNRDGRTIDLVFDGGFD